MIGRLRARLNDKDREIAHLSEQARLDAASIEQWKARALEACTMHERACKELEHAKIRPSCAKHGPNTWMCRECTKVVADQLHEEVHMFQLEIMQVWCLATGNEVKQPIRMHSPPWFVREALTVLRNTREELTFKIEGFVEHLKIEEAARRKAEASLDMVKTSLDNVWRWQGDGYDDPATLSCPVVMSADTLRALQSATMKRCVQEARRVSDGADLGALCDAWEEEAKV